MKWLVALLCTGLLPAQLFSQKIFYGVTQGGNGNIVRFDATTNLATSAYNFANEGVGTGRITQAKNGLLYGVALAGGKYGFGGIYSYNPETRWYSLRASFDAGFGQGETSELTEGRDGLLYGISPYRGPFTNDALLYSYNPATDQIQVVDSIKLTIGRAEPGGFAAAADGKLYATTENGIYSFDPISRKIEVVYESQEEYLTNLLPTLFASSNGILYGVKRSFNRGTYPETLFAFDPISKSYLDVYSFTANNVPIWNSAPLAEANGFLIGTGTKGIYTFDPDQFTMRLADTLQSGSALESVSDLIKAPDGLLYGVGSGEGKVVNGHYVQKSVLFRFNPYQFTHTVINNLTAGEYAVQGLFKSAAGTLTYVGSGRSGVAFIATYDVSTKSSTIAHRFIASSGAQLAGKLVEHPNGLLYGLTSSGGEYNEGVLFSFNIATNGLKVLKNMRAQDGSNPIGELCLDKNGVLYGMTQRGGANNAGVLFSYQPDSNLYKVIRHFDVSSGGIPQSGPVSTAAGIIFGMNSLLDGSNGQYGYHGARLFSYDPGERKFSVQPYQSSFQTFLSRESSGRLYLLTAEAVLSFDPLNSTIRKYLYNVNTLGNTPNGPLVEAADGRLYAAMNAGGLNNAGSVFRFDPLTNAFARLHDFQPSLVTAPYTPFTVGSDGMLYSESFGGGSGKLGTIFSFNTATKMFTVRQSLTHQTGWNPTAGGMIQLNNSILPRIHVADRIVNESCQNALVAVSLTKPSIYNIVVGYTTVSGTATGSGANPDYTPVNSKLIFPAGTTKMYVSVPIRQDALNEPVEQFSVVVRNLTPTRSASGDTISVITIFNSPGTAMHQPESASREDLTVFSAIVLNNPTGTEFRLKVQSSSGAVVRIIDANGRAVDRLNLSAGTTITAFGSSYRPGLYVAEVTEGRNQVTLKLIKR